MLGPAWVDLIKRIPVAQHDNLVVVTATGAEIIVQRIMHLEEQFVILRGRPAGSTDPARVLLLPWDQLNHVGFHKALPESEIQRIFGSENSVPMPEPLVEKAHEGAATAEASAPAPEAGKEVAPAAPPVSATPAAVPAPAGKHVPMSKSLLLARLRARMASEVSKG
jgi:hypothetical protein